MGHTAVERALILLRYIVDHPDGLGIRRASRNLGYSPGIVQKLVNTLEAQGYVVQDEVTGRYHLGPEAVQLGLVALSRLEVRRIARPHLEALHLMAGETVLLAVPQGEHVIYVDKIVSTQPIRMDAPLGVERPYNCTAAGKVLLASLADERVEQLLASGAFAQRTENSIVDLGALRDVIEHVRVDGWAHDHEEYSPGVECIAAPIWDHEGEVIAAVAASGPTERIDANLNRLIEQVKACADAISRDMGYRPIL
jgi:IclR family KDG regulon transcriptional repressor